MKTMNSNINNDANQQPLEAQSKIEVGTSYNWPIKHVPGIKVPQGQVTNGIHNGDRPNKIYGSSEGNDNELLIEAPVANIMRPTTTDPLKEFSLDCDGRGSAFTRTRKSFDGSYANSKSFSITPGPKKTPKYLLEKDPRINAADRERQRDSVELDSPQAHNVTSVLNLIADTPTPTTPHNLYQDNNDNQWRIPQDVVNPHLTTSMAKSHSFSPDVFGIVDTIVQKQSPMTTNGNPRVTPKSEQDQSSMTDKSRQRLDAQFANMQRSSSGDSLTQRSPKSARSKHFEISSTFNSANNGPFRKPNPVHHWEAGSTEFNQPPTASRLSAEVVTTNSIPYSQQVYNNNNDINENNYSKPMSNSVNHKFPRNYGHGELTHSMEISSSNSQFGNNLGTNMEHSASLSSSYNIDGSQEFVTNALSNALRDLTQSQSSAFSKPSLSLSSSTRNVPESSNSTGFVNNVNNSGSRHPIYNSDATSGNRINSNSNKNSAVEDDIISMTSQLSLRLPTDLSSHSNVRNSFNSYENPTYALPPGVVLEDPTQPNQLRLPNYDENFDNVNQFIPTRLKAGINTNTNSNSYSNYNNANYPLHRSSGVASSIDSDSSLSSKFTTGTAQSDVNMPYNMDGNNYYSNNTVNNSQSYHAASNRAKLNNPALTTSRDSAINSFHNNYNYNSNNNYNNSSGGMRSSKDVVRPATSHRNTNSSTATDSFYESAETKAAFKDFSEKYRNCMKKSLDEAHNFALETLYRCNEQLKWRIYFELADLEKRRNNINKARMHFCKVCLLQPKASVGWLEWSKMEEENGLLRNAVRILEYGVHENQLHEALLSRAIKLHERLNEFDNVRNILSSLKGVHIERSWKAILEGTLFEARAGNVAITREIFKSLMESVSWYGPIYYEAFRMEEKENNITLARTIVFRGLQELPRYGPLWFGFIRVLERQEYLANFTHWKRGTMRPNLDAIESQCVLAANQISKELTWKVYFELSQLQERVADVVAWGIVNNNPNSIDAATRDLCLLRDELYRPSRLALVKSMLVAPTNLRWKVFVAGARMELSIGDVDKARNLLCKALHEVPFKSKSYVLLECAKLEECIGNIALARDILRSARDDVKSEWKVYLESILLEIRCNDMIMAVEHARLAVTQHQGTGRLWAIYIQVLHRMEHFKIFSLKNNNDGGAITKKLTTEIPSKSDIIFHAVQEVPKSGELWCERSRCHLNPLNIKHFNLALAQQSLIYAVQFTPQYGDSFVEFIRFEIISQVLLPRVLNFLNVDAGKFIRATFKDREMDLSQVAQSITTETTFDSVGIKAFSSASLVEKMEFLDAMTLELGDISEELRRINFSHLNRMCINADPNYGNAWFYCRLHPFNIPTEVLENAIQLIAAELSGCQLLYCRAIFHFIVYCLQAKYKQELRTRSGVEQSDGGVNVGDDWNSLLTRGDNGDYNRVCELQVLVSYRKLFHTSTTNNNDTTSYTLNHITRLEAAEIVPLVELSSHKMYHYSDFVTGIVAINRNGITHRMHFEEKRKLLFGSDQIIS